MAVNVDRVAKRIRGGANSALKNQMIRAALSVPTNIVEGRAQRSEKDFARFLNYALGSAEELDYHLLIARDVKAITENDYRQSIATLSEVRKMLRGLIKKLSERPATSE
ncbi:MAG: four helix bundle protein [Gemmatimonadaceae bacterium]|nr:four helix bundle protein [Gemmatimonadaceae bacterium]